MTLRVWQVDKNYIRSWGMTPWRKLTFSPSRHEITIGHAHFPSSMLRFCLPWASADLLYLVTVVISYVHCLLCPEIVFFLTSSFNTFSPYNFSMPSSERRRMIATSNLGLKTSQALTFWMSYTFCRTLC